MDKEDNMAPLHDDVAWMDRDYFEPFDDNEEEDEWSFLEDLAEADDMFWGLEEEEDTNE